MKKTGSIIQYFKKRWGGMAMGFLAKTKICYQLLGMVVSMVVLCACAKRDVEEETKALVSAKSSKFVSEDFSRGNHRASSPMTNSHPHPIMETERGYYYCERSGKLSLHFYDKTNHKDIVLCNKPECKHDGNAFCVATNNKYITGGYQLYNGRIIAVSTVFEESNMHVKLLEISLDGSELTELASLYSIPNEEGALSIATDLLIHRNYACVTLGIANPISFEETAEYGTLFYNLDTGESFFANEELLSHENPKWYYTNAIGDYVYYVQKLPRGHQKLHRYNFVTRTDEELALLTNFSGNYALLNDNNVFYVRGNSNTRLYLYHPNDQSNVEFGFTTYEYEDERGETRVAQLSLSQIYTDGQYVYAPSKLYYGSYTGTAVLIYSAAGEYLKAVPLPNPGEFQIPTLSENTSVLGEADANGFLNLWFLNDKVYYSWGTTIYVTSKAALLQGSPDQDIAYEVLTTLSEANN